MSTPTFDQLNYYRREISQESTLLGNRLNSFITSQSFLIIAYASSMSGLIGSWDQPFTLLFPLALAVLGLALAFQVRPALNAAHTSIRQWHSRQDALFAAEQDLASYDLYAGMADNADEDRGTTSRDVRRRGDVFAKHVPAIFIAVWSYLAVLPIVLYVAG